MSLIGMSSVPFSKPAVWYPTLAVLALEEIVEVPMAAVVLVGRLLVAGRRPGADAGRGTHTGER